MSVSLDEISDTLLPRRYQEEIFVRAQQGNVIAALDTGSGKTFISTLLIKWISAQESTEHKITVFLVPKVALVQQQGEFIAKQTSLRVRMFSGATAHDMSDRGGWANDFETADVFVMTAQIFLNLLTHSHWSLSKVCLLVFDECHHTRKNHAYNGIMREYFQTAEGCRPKVFGMTASPIWNPRNAAESLSTLEKNLDAKVIAVKEHVDELIGHSPRPEELIKTYRQAPEVYPEYQKKSLRLRLALHNTPPEVGIPADKILTRYEVTYYSLGPFGAELFLYTEMKQRVVQLIQEAIESAMEVLTAEQYANVAHGGYLSEVPDAVHPKLREFENILAEFSADFDDPPDGVLPTPIPLSWCSPKVKVLAEELFSRYTSTFQGIVFVEQRHIATCLASMLRRIPFLVHTIKCEPLVGHGSGAVAKSHLKGMAMRNQRDTVQLFRERRLNLLVATSVAEEGLDFPACDLVIRFDPVQHMVGYLQSRGRARHKTSTFIIMVQEGSQAQAERYLEFLRSEPHLKKVYQQRDLVPPDVEEEEDESDAPDPFDLARRERYVVPSTGAILTYNTAISLLNHLCSLIPRDRFTPMHVPRYTGDFVATVTLPSTLPLPSNLLVYEGPPKRSKKEARRAAAFFAVKSLHALNVFDDYLLPAKSSGAAQDEDSDGVPIKNVESVPDMLQVPVCDPWVLGSTLWLHVVRLDGIPSAGLITGTALPPADLVANNLFVSTDEPVEIVLHPRHAWSQRRAMEEYTRMGLWWCITGRGITLPLTCYLVPITRDCRVDFDAIELAIAYPFGSYNWEDVSEEEYRRVIYMNNREFGHPLLLRRMRPDVTPSSTPPAGSREAGFPTYRDYWLHKYTRKGHAPNISLDGICVEGIMLDRNNSCSYSLENDPLPSSASKDAGLTVILPIELCRWALIPRHVYQSFFILPELCHRLTDVWRAHEVRTALKLPPIVDDLLVQAITLPSANAGFNNQRLETFGDAVLKLCAVVHLYNKYPHRHEGQLDNMKRTAIANRTLLARALEHGLEEHLTPETQSIRLWRYVVTGDEALFAVRPCRRALRQYPRRSLQDCMEAILGASFASGGIDMALRAGTALGLSFGGPTPWYVRYSGRLKEAPAAPLFAGLQETLGYTFKHGHLLLEAITHPSFRSTDCSSYQRLEFLGDAFIDMVVTEYLYRKFPSATSGQLSWARSRAVCGPAFASIAVKRLGLHKILLINNVELSMAISKHVPILEEITDEEIIINGWKHDPPKALSDVLESVLGALFVDCDYNYDKAAAITEMVLGDLLAALRPDLPKDPVTELMVWVAQSGCRCISFLKGQSRPEVRRYDCMSVLVHDTIVAGPLAAPNLSMAKGLAAERARAVLADPESPHFLSRVCTCPKKGKAAKRPPSPLPMDVPDKKELSDETTEGFAMLAQILVEETKERVVPVEDDHGTDAVSEDWIEEREVEEMMEVEVVV
ncbi:hypothetical protein BD309DRAFT_1080474 [Dichomitus squalens]|uniref:P-loop containing nucleoside triphosphate hydrolase protein n=1 Tax=Dichomitus squalens TaxID=114155 RepID=A0A4Q9MG67_9APHY|nr:hypothetical protein BD311DRAFT_867901 [Dichomitus squalens]TBU43800.1 hypothetical protein BD309DRAFT_1080474 [Dichomitus squalens]TBU57078.1 hypothetical protein BD310DRAFT_930288 [Dichomitus squalens]